jgi:hypothetical protein
MDPIEEYERLMAGYRAFLRAYGKRRRSRLQPLTWFQRLFNQVLRAFLALADSFVTAVIR